MKMPASSTPPPPRGNGWLLLTIALVVVLAALFIRSFLPGQALFANDAPLGVLKTKALAVPESFLGIWNELNWLGGDNGAFLPNVRGFLMFLGPLGNINFAVPLSHLFLGWCAWLFFRQLGFRPMVCILGGLAAALNMNFFSNGCWGLPSRATCLAMIFLALAALHSGLKAHGWIKTILAGLAIGLSISEGGDNGAIFSVFVAAYAFWTWATREGGWLKNSLLGALRVAVMAVFATLLASQMLDIFFHTSVKGIVGTGQDAESKEQRYDFATQWSLPKAESLRVIIPGLYGYRMDTPDGGNYWGRVGESPAAPQQFPRYSGAGEYAGVLVVLVACWALFGAFSRDQKLFSAGERKLIWFWAVMAVGALLLSWGRHAPFYRIVYALPYFSTIRNPMKFMHPFHLCLMVLFAYGLAGLSRRYLEIAAAKSSGLGAALKNWWSKASSSEKLWNYFCAALLAASALGWLVYSSGHTELVKHLTSTGFNANQAAEIASFSAHEVGWYLLVLLVCVGVLVLVQGGIFAGGKGGWAGLLLGVILVGDLARADMPWIKYYDYRDKYASNSVIDFLQQHTQEARVAQPPFQLGQQFSMFQQFYHTVWLQHHFPFNNIRTLDVPQEPRMAESKAAYLQAVSKNMARHWQLTNTRYLLALGGGFVGALNEQLDPAEKRFRIHTAFDLVPKPGITTPTTYDDFTIAVKEGGTLALIEFAGALPRAQLYPQWQVITNDQATLSRLADTNFNPAQIVLVSDELSATSATNAAPVAVDSARYGSREISFQTSATVPSILLLNEGYDARWQPDVDGVPQKTLRCNYLMRGVLVPPGKHTVTYRFNYSRTTIYLSAGAEAFGLLLCGYLYVRRPRGPAGKNSKAKN